MQSPDLYALYDPGRPPAFRTRRTVLVPWNPDVTVRAFAADVLGRLAGPGGPGAADVGVYRPYPEDLRRVEAALASFDPHCDESPEPLGLRFRADGKPPRILVLNLFAPPGRPGGRTVLVYAADVTAGQEQAGRAAAEHARLATLVDFLDFGVLFTDGKYRVYVFNQGAVRLFRVPDPVPGPGDDARLLRDHVARLTPDPDGFQALVERLRTRREATVRDFLFLDGRTVRMTFRPVGDEHGILWISEDITERLATERELAERAEERSRFTESVTHALRTPLTSIAGYAELLADGELPDQERRFAASIRQKAYVMQHLIEDLLLVTGLDTRSLPLHLAPMPLDRLVSDAVGEHRETAAERGVELRHSCPARVLVHCDGQRLHRVLSELVERAVRHTPRGGTVTVRAAVDGARDGWTVSVLDTGGCVPEHPRPPLPQPSDPEFATALGRAVAGAVAQAHGGSLSVDAVSRGGSQVTLRLPRHPPRLTDRHHGGV
ncbi:PAS domain-containing sensor histidine kinase [Streptomyces sp. VRA16 Mangrove soil]|uniref:sensor histidine kinase n=1 Tax=Streptomyces sp. VRA16 Mangrove soil TaxID=2817434 RepID=UPI001A9FE007|nr:PAS domain-containing sensor histidine kinase [Streptomyces sp. VRA16 Mangrove soil]MBO1333962.1 PAS domain-containing sensor histidine kinase [Streptomyces sp. VRA16 Mangrove soil]